MPAPKVVIKSKLITKLFQSLIINKDIRFFKNKKSYYLIFRIVRNFLLNDIILQIYDFKVFGSIQKNKNSYYLLKKCDFADVNELKTIKKISNESKILFLDCGCNYGFYSFYTASLSSQNIILSIEASKNTSNDFLKNLALNKFSNIKFDNKAISNSDNQNIFFYESINDWESSHSQSNFKVKSIEMIRSIKIDSLVKDLNFKNYKIIVKLDIEGNEMNALEGGLQLIKKTDPLIIIEFSRYIFKDNFKVNFFRNFLENFDYLIYDTNFIKKEFDEILHKLDKLRPKHNTIGNYYLIKNSSKDLKILTND